MKTIYPNFDFNKWLEQYYLTTVFFSYKEEPDSNQIDSERFIFQQMTDEFQSQTHLETEDIWCHACQYLEILKGFNKFCAILSQKGWKTEEIVGHFLERRYSSHKRSRQIASALCKGIKSYNSVDEHGNTFEFKKYMAQNIVNFITKLEII